jgi:hydrogenase expression/formation protein HypE
MMNKQSPNPQNLVCPVPLRHNEKIVIGHGSGGLMTSDLIKEIFQSHFSNPILDLGNDAAVISLQHTSGRLVTSTDAHIVSPLFFPGGDIGRLAVCGTVNDVAMLGAKPLYLTASFIIEEGLPIDAMEKIVQSMQDACLEAGIAIVAGDTKVTEKGKCDELFISTTGIGWLPDGKEIGGQYAKVGDAVIISGTLGDHGIAVLQARGDLGFQTDIQSDVAPLNKMLENLGLEIPEIHVLRDPTRGGLGTTLVEIAHQSHVSIQIEEQSLPVRSDVKTACEMLGFDPIYIANEGKAVILLPDNQAERALEVLHEHAYGKNAVRIGSVINDTHSRVLLHTQLGSNRVIGMLSGEMLPRIC